MTIAELEPLLRELAQKLGTTTETLFAWHLRQVYLVFFTQAALFLMLVVGTTYGIKYIRRNWRGHIRDNDLEWLVIFPAIAGIIAIAVGIFTFFSGMQLINPQYAAFKSLMVSIWGQGYR